jgi:HAMP domain-containing protein
VLAAGLAVGFELALTRSITVPLTHLAHAMERVAAGNLTLSIPAKATGEIGRLAGRSNGCAAG